MLIATMNPRLHEDLFVFCTVYREPTRDELDVAAATVREAEGITLVLAENDAIAMGHRGLKPMARITLTVHSSLEAVGLTAVVASRLASSGIPCNVIAGFYHDHLFVPADLAGAAMVALTELADPGPADPG